MLDQTPHRQQRFRRRLRGCLDHRACADDLRRLRDGRGSGTPDCVTQQRALRPGASSLRAGCSSHLAMRNGQRGANRHPTDRERIGRCALDGGQAAGPRQMPVDARHRIDQCPGIGMARIGQHLLGRPLLHHLAGIHHDDAPAHIRDHAERMADEDDAAPKSRSIPRSGRGICAWMVTSSAVVGSSAISSAGSLANPIASITRWRMPPEN